MKKNLTISLAIAVGLAGAFLPGCAVAPKQQPILATVPTGELRWVGDLPVLHVSGSAYDMGYQHGTIMRREVQASIENMQDFIRREAGIFGAGGFIANRRLDQTWRQMKPFVPEAYLEEMEGLADGAKIPLRTLQRIHALPELMSTMCASFAAYGPATKNGRLIHMRNLDWAIQSNVQRYAALIVYHPIRGRTFVSVGWLGFIGVISGINDVGISVAQIGAETTDVNLKGTPMPFILRRVLQEAGTLDQAVEIVRAAKRTGGYNYLFADAQTPKAMALETTRNQFAAFVVGQEPAASAESYSANVPNTIFRSDFAVDPKVRDLQLVCKGDPKTPGLESPVGSKAYDVRYKGQADLLQKHYGSIDPEVAMTIAAAVAPPSNMQSVIYAYPQMWVANAVDRRPAAGEKYLQVDLRELFDRR